MKIENLIRVRSPNEPRLDDDARPPMKRRPEDPPEPVEGPVEGSAGYKAVPHQWGFPARNGAESPIHRALLRSTGTSCPCGRRLRSNVLLPDCLLKLR